MLAEDLPPYSVVTLHWACIIMWLLTPSGLLVETTLSNMYLCVHCVYGGGIWTCTTIKKGKDRIKEKDKTIQRTGLFTLRPPFERLEPVPPQGMTIQRNVQKLVNLQETPDAAEEEESARRDLPGPRRGVWAFYEWRLEIFKGRGQISVQRATRALWERTCTCSWQGRKREWQLYLMKSKRPWKSLAGKFTHSYTSLPLFWYRQEFGFQRQVWDCPAPYN